MADPTNISRFVSTSRTKPLQTEKRPSASVTSLPKFQSAVLAHDIDARDSDDPLAVTAYVQDMYQHFCAKERSDFYGPYYMEQQTSINERMRSILVDWLAAVLPKFDLAPNTLYLTVNIIDRYLSKMEATKKDLQLVGITALLIASKYEEMYPVNVEVDLVYICDNAYTKEDVSYAVFLSFSSHFDSRF